MADYELYRPQLYLPTERTVDMRFEAFSAQRYVKTSYVHTLDDDIIEIIMNRAEDYYPVYKRIADIAEYNKSHNRWRIVDKTLPKYVIIDRDCCCDIIIKIARGKKRSSTRQRTLNLLYKTCIYTSGIKFVNTPFDNHELLFIDHVDFSADYIIEPSYDLYLKWNGVSYSALNETSPIKQIQGLRYKLRQTQNQDNYDALVAYMICWSAVKEYLGKVFPGCEYKYPNDASREDMVLLIYDIINLCIDYILGVEYNYKRLLPQIWSYRSICYCDKCTAYKQDHIARMSKSQSYRVAVWHPYESNDEFFLSAPN